ncbi:PDR/VanB family oxidoreductase [Pseudochelatococcus lubricantis]|uniref:PDR/VanB family oxidoreductase n=1 Tax=Pseudochelatococcus lubricantis TaxID=1538102 RepID=UPI0035EF5009
MSATSTIPVRVSEIEPVAESIKRVRLERPDGRPLPPFSPGAHVVVSMNDGGRIRRNPYSLMSEPDDRGYYAISVLRAEKSRGGSAFIHDVLKAGDELTISHPVNLFPADKRGRKHILIAGGIGITPFIAMMAGFAHDNVPFELHYAMRSRAHGAYWRDLVANYGAHRIKPYFSAEYQVLPVATLLENQPLGTHVYVCGPDRLTDCVLDAARNTGWPAANVHTERFLAPAGGKPFDVELIRSGITVHVGEHESILEAVEAAGIDAPCLCRGGACGQCETSVIACDGQLLHHDVYLSDDEKAGGRKIMICVSRFEGTRLSLDL